MTKSGVTAWNGIVTTTHYVWDGVNMVYEYTTSATSGTSYLYGIGLVATGNSSQWRRYEFNAHGDVSSLDGSYRYRYDAFGNLSGNHFNDTNPFRYCGEYYDSETETYYLRARYYNPRNGRFTQQDGWEYMDPNDPLSLNLYTYCNNNPVMYVDPSGHAGELTLTWSAGMWWLCGVDLLLPVGDIVYIAGIGVCSIADAINTIGMDNVIRIICEAPGAVAQGVQWLGNQIEQGVQWLGDKIEEGANSIKNWFKDTFGGSSGDPNQDPNKWNKGSFKDINDSLEYHFKKHGNEVGAKNIEQYLRKAVEFSKNLKGAQKYNVSGYVEGAIKYIKNGKYVIVSPDGTILSFGKVK